MRTRRTAAVLLVVFALAGCAGNVSSDGSGASSAPTSSAPTSSAPTSSAPASPAPSPSSSDATGRPTSPPIVGDEQKITGTVTRGVEPNCLLLLDSTGSHLLVFGDPSLRSAAKDGAKITVLGRPNPRLLSNCQQGVPFIVSSITAN